MNRPFRFPTTHLVFVTWLALLATAALPAQVVWSNGGPPTLNVGPGVTLTINSSSNHDHGGPNVLNVNGTVDWDPGSGAIRGGNGSGITIGTSGIFNDNASSNINAGLGGAATFTNHGTYKKLAAGTTTISQAFVNDGTVLVSAGTLVLSGGGSTSGAFNTASGGTLRIGADFAINGGSTLHGGGTFDFNSGTTTFTGSTSGNGTHSISGGTVTFNGTHAAAAVAFSGGAINGTGSLSASGAFTWTAGDLASALNSNGGATISGTGSKRILGGAQVSFAGATTWSGGSIQSGGASTITNPAGAMFTATGSNSLLNNLGGGQATFVNLGTFTKHTHTGTTEIQSIFNSTGIVNANSGTLLLSGGGSSSNAVNIASEATLRVAGSDYAFGTGTALNGPGTLELAGATTTFAGTTTGNAHLLVNGGTGTFQGTHAAGAVSLLGGTMGGPGTINSAGPFTWSAGDLRGSLNSLGGGTFSSTGAKRILDGAQLALDGTTQWTAGSIQTGGSSTTITNKAGANFNATGNDSLLNNLGGGQATFANVGTFTKSTGTGTTEVQTVFNNSGTVNANSGILLLSGGGTGNGSFNTGTNATLRFSNGYTLAAGAALNGTGTYEVTGGTVTVQGPVTPAAFSMAGGTLAGSGSVAAGRLTLSGGTLSPTSISLTGSGSVWSGGVMNGAGTTTVGAAATLDLTTGSNKDLDQRGFTNQGTVNWQSGYIRGGNGTLITNAAGATFNDQNAGSYTVHNAFGGGFTFQNDGTYRRNASGTTYFDVPFHNTGTVDLQAGDLQFRSGGSLSAAATITAATGTNVHFTNGFSIPNGASLGGTGTYRLTGGTFTIGGTLGGPNIVQTGGTLAGAQTLAGVFNWQGGDWSAAAPDAGVTTTIASGATLNLGTGASHDFNRRNIVNDGTVNWSAGYIRAGNGSVFTNQGTFVDTNASGYTIQNAFGGSFTFVNQGTYRRNAAGTTTYIDVPFTNNSLVDLQAGDLQFRGGGALAASGSIQAAAGTNVYFTNDFTVPNGASLTGAGAYRVTNGTFDVTGLINVSVLHLTGGVLEGVNTLNGLVEWSGGSWNTGTPGRTTTLTATSTLNLTTGSAKDFNARSVVNQGTVNWDAGYIRAGNGSVFTNQGTFIDSNAFGYTIQNAYGGSFTFVNQGTYRRNAAGTTSYIDVPFTNNAVVEVQAGDLQFRGGGTLAASASIHAGAGTNVHFTNGFSIPNGTSLTGPGTYWLTGGTLDVAGTVDVSTLNHTGGTLEGSHTLAGTVNWSGGSWNAGAAGRSTTVASTAQLNLTTGAAKDFNQRNITNQGTLSWHGGYLRAGNGSVLANHGTFLDFNASGYSIHNAFGGSFSFINHGTYRRDTTGITYIDVPFDNNGTVDLRQGTLQFRGGGTAAAGATFATVAGSEVHFTNGYTVQNGASLSGGGTFWLTGGTFNLAGNLNVGTFNQTGGTLAGTHAVHGVFNWSNGDWSADVSGPQTTIVAGASLNLLTGANKDILRRSVVNQGAVAWEFGYIRGGHGSTFLNAAGATFNDRNASGYTVHNPFGGSFIFTNNGTYVRDAAGVTMFDTVFDHNGVINLLQGGIHVRQGGTMSAAAVVNAAAGTNFRFAGDYTLLDGAQLTGAGEFSQTAGTFTLNGILRAATFNWAGGDWNTASAATTTIGAGTLLSFVTGNNKDFAGRAIVNQGVVFWDAGYLRGGNGSTFTNATGAVFNDRNSSSYSAHNAYGGTFAFVNNGTYAKSTNGTSVFEIPFTNTGSLALGDGTLYLRSTFTNTGTIALTAGAELRLADPATIGGVLAGSGTVNAPALSASGVVAPGAPAGTLAFTGNLTLLSTSQLLLELGGPTAGSGYDVVTVGGAANLGGLLSVSLINGFQPGSPTATFNVLTAGSSLAGAFANVPNGQRIFTADGFGSFQVNYGAGSLFATNSVVLSDFVAVPEPSTWMMLGLGTFAMLLRLRRKR